MIRGVLQAFLPRSCGGCGSPDATGWCFSCARSLAAETACFRLARLAPEHRGTIPTVWVAGQYGGVLRSALLTYKERGRPDLAKPLGQALGAVLRQAARDTSEPIAVVPVPASRAALRRRGWDHVNELVRAAPGLPPPGDLLRWKRQVADQGSLDATARARNVSRAFAVRACHQPAARRPAVLLVDDVVTTGATLAEAAKACRRAGFSVVGVAALAGTRTSGDTTAYGGGSPRGAGPGSRKFSPAGGGMAMV